MRMSSDTETVEQRLKSFMVQLQTECGILERLVYKHKNQHRRCSYFQYILKVRRDLKLLKSANMTDILDAAFSVINGNKPRQKVQLLESLKRKRCDSNKYNFMERLLGVSRLLSQMVEPILKAAIQMSTLLAQTYFMKFSLTTLAVIGRIRVLVQQMLLDAVHVYNAVSSISQHEQTIKLNKEGFEIFREYYPRKEENSVVLDCVWQIDKYVLVETADKHDTKQQKKNDQEDTSLNPSKILYENIEAFLGVDESESYNDELVAAEPSNIRENLVRESVRSVRVETDDAGPSGLNVFQEDMDIHSSAGITIETDTEKLMKDGPFMAGLTGRESSSPEPQLSASCGTLPLSKPLKIENETKKVAFLSVRPLAPSKAVQTKFHVKGMEESSGDGRDDPFFRLLTAGQQNPSPCMYPFI